MIPDTGGFTRRVSTPEPRDVPRWEEKEPALEFFDSYQPATWEQGPQTTFAGLTLPALTLSRQEDWTRDYAPQPEYIESNAASLPVTPTKGLGVSAYGVSGPTGQPNQRGPSPFGFRTEMWTALSAANAAMKAAGLGTFTITDGFRSYDAQVAAKKNKPGLAATPGRSVHGLGLAADLGLSTKQAEWLRRNGARFGLYPGAGFKKEPWHWQLLPNQVRS